MSVYFSALHSGRGVPGSAFAQHHTHIGLLSTDVANRAARRFSPAVKCRMLKIACMDYTMQCAAKQDGGSLCVFFVQR